jgi:hypothetical protein
LQLKADVTGLELRPADAATLTTKEFNLLSLAESIGMGADRLRATGAP